MGQKRICLDPGHAGPNYNAGVVSGYYESVIVWELTLLEKDILENKYGIEVVLTKNNLNEDPGLTTRGKKAKGCDLFVSNHTNACGTPSVRRAVCIFLAEREGTNIDEVSKAFASKMAQTVDRSMGGIGHQTFTKLSSKDRDGDGLKNDNYYGVLHGAFVAGVPGIIVEHSFHTNAETCKWLMDKSNLRKLAEDCAKLMAAQVGVYEPTEDDDLITASDFKGATVDEVLEIVGPLLTEDHKVSDILAAVSGAQLILESGILQTELAQNANNCFGMKASLSGNTWAGSVWDGSIYTKKTSEWDGEKYIEVVADFRKYLDIAHSIADHSAYLLNAMNGKKKRYAGLAGCLDHEKSLQIIKDGGYATSPTYVKNLLRVIDDYKLKRFDYVEEVETETKTESNVESNTDPKILKTPFTVTVLINNLNYRAEPSMDGYIKGQTGKGTFTIVEVSNGWGKLKSGAGWIWLWNENYCTINESVEELKVPFTISITNNNVYYYADHSTKSKAIACTGKGTFTIVEVYDNWGKLKSGAGWVRLEDCEIQNKVTVKPEVKIPFSVRVKITNLDIRTGAGTTYAKTGASTGIGVFTIVEVKEGPGSDSGWGRLKSGAGWISLDYAEKL